MPTIMTILSCLLIGQYATDQEPAVAPVETTQQIIPAENDLQSTDAVTQPARVDNSRNDAATASDIPDASNILRSEEPSEIRASTTAEQPGSTRMRPPQLIAEAMALPPGGTITGQPLPLIQAISATADRRQQLAIAQVYWKTVEAAAKYRYCLDQVERLGRLQSRRGEEVLLQAARSEAAASLKEAELTAVSAQYELAALMQFPPNVPLPLPADRPHVGAYRTNFQELFAARQAPDRAKLIDRTLPIRRMAIDQRAIAVQAAIDALTAAGDAYQAGRCGLSSVISNGNQLIRQQRAFIETVCRYNQDIAEYAMIVAAPGTVPQVLIGFMIKTQQEPGQFLNGEMDGGVRPAGLQEPVSSSSAWSGGAQSVTEPRSVPGASVITTVPPATQWGPSGRPVKNEPTLAPPLDSATLKNKTMPTPARPRGLAPVGVKNEPTLAPPRPESKSKADGESAPAPLPANEPEKTRYDSGDPFMQKTEKVFKPVNEIAEATEGSPKGTVPFSLTRKSGQSPIPADWQENAAGSVQESQTDNVADAGASSALYPALVDASASARAKQLTLALHWDRTLPDGAGRPMTLEESLSRQVGPDRRATVAAYWIARERAAEYQAVAQEMEFLDDLAPFVLENRDKPDGAEAMLFLRTARQIAKADLQEAQAALVEAQFELAVRTQLTGESLWPLPSTPPHAGQYALNLEAQPPALVQSWPMRQLASAIPAYGTSLQECAAAVVSADSARAKAVEQYIAGNSSMEQVLEEVGRQTYQTFDFLKTLTDYNRSIAQYALAVLPADAPPARITAALVVQR